jgi:hypothetical protein
MKKQPYTFKTAYIGHCLKQEKKVENWMKEFNEKAIKNQERFQDLENYQEKMNPKKRWWEVWK